MQLTPLILTIKHLQGPRVGLRHSGSEHKTKACSETMRKYNHSGPAYQNADKNTQSLGLVRHEAAVVWALKCSFITEQMQLIST